MNRHGYDVRNAATDSLQPAPEFRGNYFEFDGPAIRTRYSEVFWRAQTSPLPDDIVRRYAGRVMAVTGYETDIMRTLPNGTNVSASCYHHYNHHYSAWMHGSGVRMLSEAQADAVYAAHGLARPTTSHGSVMPVFVPTSAPALQPAASSCDFGGVWFNARNGISVNVTQAPGTSTFTASCIGDAGWKHATGIVLPPNATDPQGGATLNDGSSLAIGVFSTSSAPGSPACSRIAFNDHNTWCRQPYCAPPAPPSPPSPVYPDVQAFSEGNGNEYRRSYRGYARGYAQLIHSPTTWVNNPMMINTRNPYSDAPVGGPLPRLSLAPPNASYSGILECPCTTRKVRVYDGYESLPAAGAACDADARIVTLAECRAAATNAGLMPVASATSASAGTVPPGCSAVLGADGWIVTLNSLASSAQRCGPAASPSGGHATAAGRSDTLVGVQVHLDAAAATATLRLEGPAAVWFGVGFNASTMGALPYAIIVAGNGSVSERRLGPHEAGDLLAPSVRVVSNTVAGGNRTVVLQRPLAGASPAHFTFRAAPQRLPLIEAVGSTAAFSYHKSKQTALLTIAGGVDAPTCVCRDPNATGGTINGARFSRNCAPFPESTLVRDHNPICVLKTYGGGLACCGDKSVLLDADQDIPGDEDAFFFRYRFYVEDGNASEAGARPQRPLAAEAGLGDEAAEGALASVAAGKPAQNLFRLWWATESYNNEYDVPQCAPGTPPAECVHVIESNFTAAGLFNSCMASGAACGDPKRVAAEDGGNFKLAYAAAHCHAPACMSVELWNTDTGTLVCRNEAVYGTGNEPHNESSFVVGIPPCLWGDAEDGLPPPPVLNLKTNLYSIKRVNNTFGHWGVMALWQMRGAYLNATV